MINTVKIGDKFEKKALKIIHKAIKDGQLSINEAHAEVFEKKAYYSRDREKDIIFDLSIEIWPEKAKDYSLVYFIECKSGKSKSTKVPIDDIEEFHEKVRQVSGLNCKAVMITDKSFGKTTFTYARNKGVMLIEVKENSYEVKLHTKNQQNQDKNITKIDDKIQKLVTNLFLPNKITGLKKLSGESINQITTVIIDEYVKTHDVFSIRDLVLFIQKKYKIKIDLSKDLQRVKGAKIDGYYDVKNKVIYIDKYAAKSERFAFVVGHELGHYFLHSNLKVNQSIYNNFEDSQYNLSLKKHELKNPKHWIEWQANKFSACLMLPKNIFIIEFVKCREDMGISSPHTMYLDKQVCNQLDYFNTVNRLAMKFRVSKMFIQNRIEELNLITHG